MKGGRVWVVVVMLVAMLMLVGAAEAKPLAKVYGVTLEITEHSEAATELYGDWEVRHWDRIGTAPDKIETMLLVNNKIVHNHVRSGFNGCVFSYKIYTESTMTAGTQVTFAVRAITGSKVQKWQQASVTVP